MQSEIRCPGYPDYFSKHNLPKTNSWQADTPCEAEGCMYTFGIQINIELPGLVMIKSVWTDKNEAEWPQLPKAIENSIYYH